MSERRYDELKQHVPAGRENAEPNAKREPQAEATVETAPHRNDQSLLRPRWADAANMDVQMRSAHLEHAWVNRDAIAADHAKKVALNPDQSHGVVPQAEGKDLRFAHAQQVADAVEARTNGKSAEQDVAPERKGDKPAHYGDLKYAHAVHVMESAEKRQAQEEAQSHEQGRSTR